MYTAGFDSLGWFERFKAADMSDKQAKALAEAMREHTEQQAREFQERTEQQKREFQETLEKYDEARCKDLATRGDVQDVRLEIEKVRAEVERVKYDLLKWQIASWVALAAVMAKGFGWLGF